MGIKQKVEPLKEDGLFFPTQEQTLRQLFDHCEEILLEEDETLFEESSGSNPRW